MSIKLMVSDQVYPEQELHYSVETIHQYYTGWSNLNI